MIDRSDRYYLTTAEMLVMRTIWKSDHDLVLHEVMKSCNESYGKDWKPQTVSTYLSHLVQKDFLRMKRTGKVYTYCPIISGEEYMKYDMGNFIDYWDVSLADLIRTYVSVREISNEECLELKDYVNSL